ncbi:MAG: SPOR domain-containing protein, partial [Croceibacterium sp.]
AQAPAAAPAVAVAPPPPRDLRQAFADFTAATAAPATAVPAGAVNMATFQPRREPPPPKPETAKPAPAKPAPPPKPVIPSRHWVQIATGRDLGALGFDWRRLKREAGGLLDKHQPQYADWGQTNRMVVGPFASVREAEQFVGKLKDKKLDSFRFTSDQGEEVKPLK